MPDYRRYHIPDGTYFFLITHKPQLISKVGPA